MTKHACDQSVSQCVNGDIFITSPHPAFRTGSSSIDDERTRSSVWLDLERVRLDPVVPSAAPDDEQPGSVSPHVYDPVRDAFARVKRVPRDVRYPAARVFDGVERAPRPTIERR